jgi:hypothetical protein
MRHKSTFHRISRKREQRNLLTFLFPRNYIGGVMVSVLASSAIDRGFEPQSSQIKDCKIGICCFSAHATLRRKSKDWLARNQVNVSEWGDPSIS